VEQKHTPGGKDNFMLEGGKKGKERSARIPKEFSWWTMGVVLFPIHIWDPDGGKRRAYQTSEKNTRDKMGGSITPQGNGEET